MHDAPVLHSGTMPGISQTKGNSSALYMEVRIVFLPKDIKTVSDEIYKRCLQQVDDETQSRIRRFYWREDAWRSLVGALLPRKLLQEHGISLRSVTFGRTAAGKPYIKNAEQSMGSTFTYNISHDNLMVAMVAQFGGTDKIGIDIMRRSIPKDETVVSFLRVIEDNLTSRELSFFGLSLDPATAEKYIFRLWTLKEAYTKALGIGLGFDFRRIDYDIHNNRVLIDEEIVPGWEFIFFDMEGVLSGEIYQGSVARWVGGEVSQVVTIPNIHMDARFRVQQFEDLSLII